MALRQKSARGSTMKSVRQMFNMLLPLLIGNHPPAEVHRATSKEVNMSREELNNWRC